MASSSSSTSPSSPSVHVNLFHTIDRRLYALLVVSLVRDPAESMQVLALWLWLQARGLPHAVNAILSLPHFVVNELADEASACLALISSSSAATAALFSPSFLPLTQSVLETDHHPPGLIQALIISNSHSIALDLSATVKDICLRSMSEITVVTITATAPVPAPAPAPAPASTAIINNNTNNNGRKSVGHPDSRTMFATFSKGYPVYEWEVRNFFGRAYGDACIEALHMQEVTEPKQQPLYARIVFSVPRIINAILQGSAKAKFTINGKHVWMRRFVPKKPRAAHRQQQQQQEQPPPSPDSPPPPPSPPPEPETAEDEREPLPELPASLFD